MSNLPNCRKSLPLKMKDKSDKMWIIKKKAPNIEAGHWQLGSTIFGISLPNCRKSLPLKIKW